MDSESGASGIGGKSIGVSGIGKNSTGALGIAEPMAGGCIGPAKEAPDLTSSRAHTGLNANGKSVIRKPAEAKVPE